LTFNQLVAGSNPAGRTINSLKSLNKTGLGGFQETAI